MHFVGLQHQPRAQGPGEKNSHRDRACHCVRWHCGYARHVDGVLFGVAGPQRRKLMSARMSAIGRRVAGPVELARRHGLERIAAWEQPSLWRRNAPPVAQKFKQHRGEHRVAILAALALLDPQQHALRVDVGHLQRGDLRHAQARTIGGAERGLVLDAGGGLQKTRHLLAAQHDRNLPRLRDKRQVLDGVGPIERHREKEAQRRDREVDARRAHPVLGQVQLEKPQIFGCRRVGRSAKEDREVLDGPDVVLLRLLTKVPQRHVFDHALPQRADALIGHGILLSEPRLLTPRSSDRSIRPVTALPSIPDTTLRAALYRASGFVQWGEPDSLCSL